MSWIQIIGLIGALLLGVYNAYNNWRQNEPVEAAPGAAVVLVAAFRGPRAKPEKGGGKSNTEQAGYIPPKVQIERMIQAGERLAQARREEFDLPEGTEDPGPEADDPTREPGFDMADASVLGQGVEERLRAAQKVADAAKVVPEPGTTDKDVPVKAERAPE